VDRADTQSVGRHPPSRGAEHPIEQRANSSHEHRGKVRVHESGHAVNWKVRLTRVNVARGRDLGQTDVGANLAVGPSAKTRW
jgi:hypothetical protein